MLDYELFEEQPGGDYVGVALQALFGNVKENGGLLRFTMKADTRYYLVYSKTYRLTPVNEAPNMVQSYYRFKVRHGEATGNSDYADSDTLGNLVDPDLYMVDTDSIEYHLYTAPA